jgi:hypothetical protein
VSDTRRFGYSDPSNCGASVSRVVAGLSDRDVELEFAPNGQRRLLIVIPESDDRIGRGKSPTVEEI